MFRFECSGGSVVGRLLSMTRLRATAGLVAGLVTAVAVTGCSATGDKSEADLPDDARFPSSLKQVMAQCPPSYPEDVTPMPTDDEVSQLSMDKLVQMLDSWNPALRKSAANEFARRGDEMVDLLKQLALSDSANRRAGGATALSMICRYQMRNWQEVYPDIEKADEAREKLRGKFEPLIGIFVKLTRDDRRDVRDAALSGLVNLGTQRDDAKLAVLDMCDDPDEYLAQNAMIIFEKHFSAQSTDPAALDLALRTTMDGPLPRAKGHAMRIIQELDEQSQRAFIPVMLEHLDWQPDRDTMFGAGGQEAAVKLLTKFKVKELLPRIPALMDKTMRGPGLFQPCLESARAFGADAKVILPQLHEYARGLEQKIENSNSRTRAGLEKKLSELREVVQYVESL